MITRVASVHFAPLHAERPYGGVYDVIAVAPGGAPVFVTEQVSVRGKVVEQQGCTDRTQRERGGFSDSPNPRTRSIRATVVVGEEIAPDLVDQWSIKPFGSSTSSHPGVWVVRDRMPELDEEGRSITDAEGRQQWRMATPEEQKSMWDEDLAANRIADSGYARDIFDTWNAKIEEHPDMVKTLPKSVRLAAEAYGWTAEWLRDGTVLESKECQFCTKKVKKATIVCPYCQQVIDYDAFAREKQKRDAASVADVVAAGVTGRHAGKNPEKAA